LRDHCQLKANAARSGARADSCYPNRQHTNPYQSKYLPVIDLPATSYSSNDFLSVLRSSSLPIRATFYRSWLDSRLVPWLHFVPMNNHFDDLYRLMEYFLGCPASICGGKAVKGHDAQAQKIANAGRDWAAKVARNVDMEIYVFRLLLEWARVTDDKRHRLGFIEPSYLEEQRHSELKKRGSHNNLHEKRHSDLKQRETTHDSLSDKARKAALFEAALTSRESRLAGKHLTRGHLWGSTQDWLHGRWAYGLEFDIYGVMKGYQRWVGLALYRECRFSVDCMRSSLINQKTGEPIL
jgi:Glycosyl transferase family 90